jgi:hypothetical protein
MKKEEIGVGQNYLAKVGTRYVEVTIDSTNGRGGWNATSVASGKPVRVKDVKHLKAAPVATEAAPEPRKKEKPPTAPPPVEMPVEAPVAASEA